jgi:hypothetical protein
MDRAILCLVLFLFSASTAYGFEFETEFDSISDSSGAEKFVDDAMADFDAMFETCDFSRRVEVQYNTESALRDAIESVNSGGPGVVLFIPSGKYSIYKNLPDIKQDCVIVEGEKIAGQPATVIASRVPKGPATLGVIGKNIKLHNLIFEHPEGYERSEFGFLLAVGWGADHALIENCIFRYGSSFSIYSAKGKNIIFRNNIFENTRSDGIHVGKESKNVIITNNSFINTGDDSIGIVWEEVDQAQGMVQEANLSAEFMPHHVLIYGNKITRDGNALVYNSSGGKYDAGAHGVLVLHGRDIKIIKNDISNTTLSGISVTDWGWSNKYKIRFNAGWKEQYNSYQSFIPSNVDIIENSIINPLKFRTNELGRGAGFFGSGPDFSDANPDGPEGIENDDYREDKRSLGIWCYGIKDNDYMNDKRVMIAGNLISHINVNTGGIPQQKWLFQPNEDVVDNGNNKYLFENYRINGLHAFEKQDEVIWQGGNDKSLYVGYSGNNEMNFAGILSQYWGAPDWSGTGDFNGDGKSDLAWFANDKLYMFFYTDSGLLYKGVWKAGLGNPKWAGVGDFDGDGKSDLAWYNNGLKIYRSTGHGFFNLISYGWGNPDWAGIGDFTGDGRADIAWYHKYYKEGTLFLFKQSGNGFTLANSYSGWGMPGWAGFGDFSGDGKSDLAWFENGKIRVFYSAGLSLYPAGGHYNGYWGTNWAAPAWAGIGDFTGDGKADLAWVQEYLDDGTMYVFTPKGPKHQKWFNRKWWKNLGHIETYNGSKALNIHVGNFF